MSNGSQSGSRRPEVARGPAVRIRFEGRELPAFRGEPVAVSLLAGGVRVLSRSIKFHRPRSVFCMTGDCGACLMRIDGQPNQRACRVPVHDGLSCERQNAFPSASFDILAAADEMFPDGMDHHSMMTAPRPLNVAMQKVVQRLGGLGKLPDAEPAFSSLPSSHSRHVAVLVVGGGPAGLACATHCARALAPKSVLLIEAATEVGGSYWSDPRYGAAAVAQAHSEATAAGVEMLTDAAAIGYYPEDLMPGTPQRGLVAVLTSSGMLKLTADRIIYATGGHVQNLLFEGNDRPGVLAARAVGRLHTQHGLSLWKKPLVVGDGEYADALAQALRDAGASVRRVDGRSERIERALGRSWVTGAVLSNSDGLERQIECDLIAVVQAPAPAFELAQMHGAQLRFDDQRGFVVITDENGRIGPAGAHACGEVTGGEGVAAARLSGQRVGAAVAAELG